jgi:SAM-dependent methyltransferase
MPATYFIEDCNALEARSNLKFDLIVNHAAMHHVAYINRLTCNLANSLQPGGRYIAFDYVGPHRNQYPYDMWSAILEFNETLLSKYRMRSRYPHLNTMLSTDPTEAIHSELQIEVLERYFTISQLSVLGGPIAYHILFDNRTLFEERNTPDGASTVARLIEADNCLVSQRPDLNLFAFWIAEKKSDFPKHDQIDAWQAQENEREEAAVRNNGRYYPLSAMEIMNNEIADLRYKMSIV